MQRYTTLFAHFDLSLTQPPPLFAHITDSRCQSFAFAFSRWSFFFGRRPPPSYGCSLPLLFTALFCSPRRSHGTLLTGPAIFFRPCSVRPVLTVLLKYGHCTKAAHNALRFAIVASAPCHITDNRAPSYNFAPAVRYCTVPILP